MSRNGSTEPPTWEEEWEVALSIRRPQDMLTALLMRDLMHGSSLDVDLGGDRGSMEVDYLAGDEEEAGSYRLLLTAHVRGPEDREALHELTRDLLEQSLTEAEEMAARRRRLGARALAELRFVVVPESEERWDLVVPDWLAPDGAEVPFGFRPADAKSDEPWPSDAELDAHGRVVAVVHDEELHLFGVPAPTETEAARRLPVHPSS